MSVINYLKRNIRSGTRLYALLAIVVIAAVVIGNLIFVRSVIVPQWRLRRELASKLIETEQRLREAQDVERSPEELRRQLETAQTELEEAAKLFFSETQAAEILDNLYEYAEESGVKILDLQSLPGPEEEKQDLYDTRTFQLQVKGSIPDLISFISQVKEATLESFLIDNVKVDPGKTLHNLTMDVTLHTSPYSPGSTGPVDVVPTTTPMSLEQLEASLIQAWSAEDWDRAIFTLNQILAVEPDYPDVEEKLYQAYVNYGSQFLLEGNRADAIAQFNRALEIDPGGEEALAGLRQASATPTPTLTAQQQLEQDLDEAWEDEEWEEALDLIERILALDPDDEEMIKKHYAAYVNYGYQLLDDDEFEEAKEVFAQALAINPEGGEAAEALRQLAEGTPTPTPTSTPTPEPQYVIHVVQRGENLFRIALRYGTTVEAIKAANDLTDNNIYVGQRLRIPTP